MSTKPRPFSDREPTDEQPAPVRRARTEEVVGPAQGVLIVEDDDDLRAALSSLLAEHGFMTMAVANGREALDLLRLCRPGVVLLDLTMPYLDGHDVLAF